MLMTAGVVIVEDGVLSGGMSGSVCCGWKGRWIGNGVMIKSDGMIVIGLSDETHANYDSPSIVNGYGVDYDDGNGVGSDWSDGVRVSWDWWSGWSDVVTLMVGYCPIVLIMNRQIGMGDSREGMG